MQEILKCNIVVVGGKKMVGKVHRLLYSAKHHGGLNYDEFRKRCDRVGPTLTIIQNDKGYVHMCTCRLLW